MRVLFDTNVVLDVLLDRAPHAEAATQLMSLVDAGRLEGLLCATTVTTVYYIAGRELGQRAASDLVRTLLDVFRVAPVDHEILDGALDLGFSDFEDAVVHQAAVYAEAQSIVTRNGTDFKRATLAVMDPTETLAAILAAGL